MRHLFGDARLIAFDRLLFCFIILTQSGFPSKKESKQTPTELVNLPPQTMLHLWRTETITRRFPFQKLARVSDGSFDACPGLAERPESFPEAKPSLVAHLKGARMGSMVVNWIAQWGLFGFPSIGD